MYKDLDTAGYTKTTRLQLIGHAVRMDHERVVRMIFESKPEEGRRMGRPKLRWLEDAGRKFGR
jgi:hypothetical protein